MNSGQGLFIVIEGTDGSGKGTQFKLLSERLIQEGYDVATFDFPQYDQPSSYFVKQYLNGEYGTAEQIGPYTASLFYALDRYEAAPKIREALEQGKVVLANRFTGSNMAHQGTKFGNSEERRGYFIWNDNLEFEMLRIPRPTMSFVLRVPAETAQQLVDQKEARSYTDKKRDIHEADLNHLQRAVAVYDDLCQLFPKDFQRIDCVRDNQLLSIGMVQELIWQKVDPMLPERASRPAATSAAPAKESKKSATAHPYINRDRHGRQELTQAGQEFLAEAVTNTDRRVFAFGDKLSSAAITAAMARLSGRGGDLRTILLDEFAQAAGEDEKLMQRAAAHGDRATQLFGRHFVFEGVSNLLAKKLTEGRLGAYAEPNAAAMRYDQKATDGEYKFYVPEYLDAAVQKSYRKHLTSIFDLYAEMVAKLTDYLAEGSQTPKEGRTAAWRNNLRDQAREAASGALPVASTVTVGAYVSGQALERMVSRLLADDLPESRQTGELLVGEMREALPGLLEQTGKPDLLSSSVTYTANTRKAVRKLAEEHLPNSYAAETEPVQLISVWPRNETDLVADMLYEHSNLPLRRIQQGIEAWPYNRRLDVFEAYLGDRPQNSQPGRALEKAHYSWDLVCDYSAFRTLQQHHMVDDPGLQHLTPRYGYDVPAIIEEAGLEEQYEECFGISLELYDTMQQTGYALESQYATLLGHRLRCKVTYNAREAFHLHESASQHGPAYERFVQRMHAKLAEVHPMIAEAMKFAGQRQNAGAAHLAPERSAQH
jgi:dTMP kinase